MLGPQWLLDVTPVGDAVHVVRAFTTHFANSVDGWPLQIATVDIAERAHPVLTASAELGFAQSRVYPNYRSAVISPGTRVTAIGRHTLAFTQDQYLESPEGVTPVRTALRWVSVQDPQSPSSTEFELPDGMPATYLLSSGEIIARSRFVPSPDTKDSVRFYLDRIDVSDPGNPVLLPPISVPGSLLSFDAATGHAVTVDYVAATEMNLTARECFNTHARTRVVPTPGVDQARDPGNHLGACTAISYALHLIAIDDDSARILGMVELPDRESIQLLALGEDRLFIALGSGGNGTWDNEPVATTPQRRSVLTIGGTSSGRFSQGRVVIDGDDKIGIYPRIAASGIHAVIASSVRGTLTLIEAEDAAAPSVVREQSVAGTVEHMNVAGRYFIAALGPKGVAVMSLEP